MAHDDRLRAFASSAVRQMRGEPDPAADRPADGWGDGMSFGRPEGWRPPSPGVIADEPDQLEEEERAARREPMSEIEQAASDAVAGWYPHRTPVKLEDLVDAEPAEVGFRPSTSEIVQMVLADGPPEDFDSPSAYARWMQSCTDSQWSEALEEAGWDPATERPGRGDWPGDVELENLRADLEAEAERMKARGRYLE